MSSTKKSSSSKTKTKKTSSRKPQKKTAVKKGKVSVPGYKVIIICAVVIVACVALLFATGSADKRPLEMDSKITDRYTKTEIQESPVKKEAETLNAASGGATETPQRSSVAAETETKKTEPVAAKPVQKKVEPVPAAPKKSEELQKAPDPKPVSLAKPAEGGRPETTATSINKFDFPQAKNGAQIVLLLDDGGQNLSHLKKFLDLPVPVTVAILPKLRDTVSSANAVRASGNEVMLHQPMQALNQNVNPGPGAIKPDMTNDRIKSLILENLKEVGPVSGMNNHEGSMITADAGKMQVALQTAHEQGIYFLDSRTNVETKIPVVSREMGYSWYERNGLFLDNEKTRKEFLTQLRKNLDIANKSGCVIMIAHVWSADYLPDLIREVYPELKSKGYEFTTVGKSRGLKR